ncbi:potassium transporter Kup [Formicincola oecophyllae]|uniref:Probable potassium transport system protein Kup n=1 Tax=Formicincola oecophyllae TaxID=2558361 RepID=A0A4Y6UC93_9PROT|nr:potassium transporter Kup [Formicincola oecophyllae]QDH13735.1 potassium transporter Kup [Formicincola oecophyllae]
MADKDDIALRSTSSDASYPSATGRPTVHPSEGHHAKPRGWGALLAVLGVVYGDIGTSPLYALQASVRTVSGATHKVMPSEIMGLASLTFWALFLVVTLKYVWLVMRADHNGEGGIIALTSLAQRVCHTKRTRYIVGMIGLIGTCLFFGDSVITPAISVLSAVEGVEISVPAAKPFIIPAAVAVLVCLFAAQALGTGKIGRAFGPVMLLWFLALGIFGARGIMLHPSILWALSPWAAFHFVATHGLLSFFALGTVVLSVTGAEALYADMGHFGRSPIRCAWLFFVLPCLTLNYLGQAALMIHSPATMANPFYFLAPHWIQVPLLLLATMATVIASQAGISGSFSLCRQLVQLGYLPLMRIVHTNPYEEAQIYMPTLNWLLASGAILLVFTFRSSEALAGAYGIAVTGTFLCTTILSTLVFRRIFHWRPIMVDVVFGFYFLLDGTFFAANILKIPDGGWVPLTIATGLVTIMTTWQYGQQLVRIRERADSVPMASFLARLTQSQTIHVPGISVFLTADPELVPDALLLNLRHNHILHDHTLFVTVVTLEQPEADPGQRLTVQELAPHMHRVILRYGFMEMPNVPLALTQITRLGVYFDPIQASYFISHDIVFRSQVSRIALWRMWIFLFLLNNATPVTEFFRVPPERVVEFSVRIAI